MAIYSVVDSNWAVTSINCKKTKGMFTGKDGRFHFPVERLNGGSPGDVTAIKPGYYGNDRLFPTIKVSRSQSVEAYSNRDHYLIKQNPDKPEFRFGDAQEVCMHAEYREDIEASILFQKIMIAEAQRLNADTRIIDNFKRGISFLEARPSKLSKP